MGKQLILEKAIKKAVAAGFDDKGLTPTEMLLYLRQTGEQPHTLAGAALWQPLSDVSFKQLIFDHDFAKALWGEDYANFYPGQSGDTLTLKVQNWRGHLANMAVADDPIKYLGENI